VQSEVVWVVDWDIPLTKDRYKFYHALRKLKERLGLAGGMSTMSVLITADENLAYEVYNLAQRFTERVHIYRAVEV